MNVDMETLLAQYALGILPPPERAAVERYLASSGEGTAQLYELHEAVSSMAAVAPGQGRPASASRMALLELGRGAARFLPFVDRVATLFDVSDDDASDALALIDRASVWQPLRPGVRYVDVPAGPGVGERHAGLVRMGPGVVFPHHTHQGDESFLILQGQARDSQGMWMQPGDEITNRDGTGHSVTVVGDQELIYAIVLGSYTIVED